MTDHWLPGFNFNVEEWDEKGTRRVQGGRFGEAIRALHDPQSHPRREATPRRRLVMPVARTARCRGSISPRASRFCIAQ